MPSRDRKEWTKEEDERLLAEQLRLGRRWAEIAKLLPGRTGADALQRFERLQSKAEKSGDRQEWTKEEDERLLAEQLRLGRRWADIAKLLPGRTGADVQYRLERLTEKSGGRWTKEEDQSLLAAQLRLGRQWAEIAKLLPGRNGNDARARFVRLEGKKRAAAAAVMAQGNAAAGGAGGGGGGARRSAAATFDAEQLAEQRRRRDERRMATPNLRLPALPELPDGMTPAQRVALILKEAEALSGWTLDELRKDPFGAVYVMTGMKTTMELRGDDLSRWEVLGTSMFKGPKSYLLVNGQPPTAADVRRAIDNRSHSTRPVPTGVPGAGLDLPLPPGY